MKKKISVTQLLRHLVQTAAFVFFPGLFLSVFNALRDVVASLVAGTFSFKGMAGQLVLLLVVFLFTVLWGRFFCGYLCAFGAVQELIGWISKRLLPRLRTIPSRVDRVLKYLKYAVLAAVLVLFWIVQLPVDSSLSPWGVFGMLVSGNLSVIGAAVPTVGFAALIAILIGSFFVERFFCRYLCPLGALFTLSSGRRLFRIRRKEESCSGCAMCTLACAMGINVHDLQTVQCGECIDCMRCTEACPAAALCSNPHPAVAGTAASLMMCGLVSVGNIAAEKLPSAPYEIPAGIGVYTGSSLQSGAKETPSPYTDGVYTGTGSGFRGEVQVQVTVENGMIADITVLSHKDDAQYFNKAKNSVIAAILEQQAPAVDAVSGATFSSNGIMEAVADALHMEYSSTVTTPDRGMHEHGQSDPSANGSGKQKGKPDGTSEQKQSRRLSEGSGTAQEGSGESSGKKRRSRSSEDSGQEKRNSGSPSKETKPVGNTPEPSATAPAGQPEETTPAAEELPSAPASAFADGVYTGTGKGFRGTTEVQVTVENGSIADITVLSYTDDRQYFSRAQSGVIAAILNSQSIDVSTVSGATFSSNGILEAVAKALDLDFVNPNASSGSGHGRR